MRISDWSSDVCSSDLLFIDILRDFKIVQGSYSLSMVVRQGDQLIFPGSGICELLMTCSLFLVGHNQHTYGVFITHDPPACPIPYSDRPGLRKTSSLGPLTLGLHFPINAYEGDAQAVNAPKMPPPQTRLGE